MNSYYLPGSALPLHRWGSGSCEKLSNLPKFTQVICSLESDWELNYVSFQNKMRALERGGTVLGIIKDFLSVQDSVPPFQELSVYWKSKAPDHPPPFLSRDAHSASADGLGPVGWRRPFGPGWTLSADGCPLAPASLCRLHESSRDSVLRGSEEGAHGCYGPCFTSSFFWLLLAVTEAW